MDVVLQDIAIAGRRSASLTLADRPRLGEDVALAVLDGEGVLLDGVSGMSHLLNPTATAVVRCLDGATPLSTLCDELAAASGADPQRVRDDVLPLVQDVGRRGLLDGVEPEVVHEHAQAPTLPVGTPLLGLEAVLPDGTTVDDTWLADGDALVVSWSARCGWCSRLAPDLAAAQTALEAAGTRVLLLHRDPHEAVAAQLGASRLRAAAVVDGLPGWFAGLGTPVAYTVSMGRTTAPLVHGALEVASLLDDLR